MTGTSVSARDRLVQAAADLFHEAGIVATSVDEVVAAAGVSKPTLYAKFSSKSELLLAVLASRDAARRQVLTDVLERAGRDPAAQILAVFGWLARWLAEESFRGCALVNAAAELGGVEPGVREAAARNKAWVRARFAALARRAGLAAPDALAASLLLLMEGATTMALLEGGGQAGRTARAAAKRLLVAHGYDPASDQRGQARR
ncbi:MAG: helix-turn-helix domain-containing protein [Alphaproteobacteria bacterium]|nr:helix-turn-helix domain-containing protein [Alphaproteobacteria bacterium]